MKCQVTVILGACLQTILECSGVSIGQEYIYATQRTAGNIKMNIRKQRVRTRTGFVWLRIESNDKLL